MRTEVRILSAFEGIEIWNYYTHKKALVGILNGVYGVLTIFSTFLFCSIAIQCPYQYILMTIVLICGISTQRTTKKNKKYLVLNRTFIINYSDPLFNSF